jgi:hypothetical protein
MINKQTIDKIAAQSINEIDIARTYKNGKVKSWQSNESMYYGVKETSEDSRANISLGRMQEFVHTLLSKIDNPLVFKFTKRKPSQLSRVELLNSLRRFDADRNFWDLKDIVGKKQGIIYGRAIYAYYASSDKGTYESNLENVDVYDFLIDPSCGGIDIENAFFMGRWGVVKTIKQLKDGVKNKIYNKEAVSRLIESGGNSTEENQEETNKRSRSYDQETIGDKENNNHNKFKLWEWFTTFEGERYYILMDNSGQWIRCEKLSDMFSCNTWPFWTWAAFPDLTEFWTPSYCDYARDLFLAQDASIGQMLDNADAINKPMRAVDVSAIDDVTKLKYRKDGIIPVKKGVDINRAYQTVITPSINTPIQVFEILEGIQEKASGVTAQAKGTSDEKGKVGIYQGNEAAMADRFGLLNKSYSFGYKRFAKLYENGVKDHLIKKIAIEILGPNGVEVKQISKRDLYKKGDEYGITVEASNAEMMASKQDRNEKLAFLASEVNNPMINKKKSFEMRALISGLSEEDVRQLLDTNSYGNEKLISEADRDLESLLMGEVIEINDAANNQYKQRMVDYLRDHKEDINDRQFFAISAYIDSLEDVIFRNEARKLVNEQSQEMLNPELNPLNINQPQPEMPQAVQTNGQI